MNICGKTFSSEIITRIRATVEAQPTISRRKLSQKVFEWLDWRSANGRWKEMSCRVALLKLHRGGHIILPAAGQSPQRQPKEEEGSEEIPAIACDLSELGRLELIRIKRSDKKRSRLWNSLMKRYHYLGAGPLCGAQMRYLIHSERFGFLGGVAVTSARPLDRPGMIGRAVRI